MPKIIKLQTETKTTSFSDHLTPDSVLKIVAVVTALLYGEGYLIVTLHLSKYGVSSFEILKLQYLMAGFWHLLPLAAAVTLPILAFYWWKVLRQLQQDYSTRSFIIVLCTLIFVAAIIQVLFMMISVLSTETTVFLLFIPVMIMILVIGIIRKLGKSAERSGWKSRFTASALNIAFAIPYVILTLPWFVEVVYPEIPRSLGGGRPILARIIPNGVHTLDNLPFLSGVDSCGTFNCKLLLETSDQVVLLPYDSSNSAISINKDLIAALVLNP